MAFRCRGRPGGRWVSKVCSRGVSGRCCGRSAARAVGAGAVQSTPFTHPGQPRHTKAAPPPGVLPPSHAAPHGHAPRAEHPGAFGWEGTRHPGAGEPGRRRGSRGPGGGCRRWQQSSCRQSASERGRDRPGGKRTVCKPLHALQGCTLAKILPVGVPSGENGV